MYLDTYKSIDLYAMKEQELLINVLSEFKTIGLASLPTDNLMCRQESKFILNSKQLVTCLRFFKNDFNILCIEGNLEHKYQTKYYDDDNLRSYNDHHRGKGRRFKIRKRRYLSNGQNFFEIKLRDNKKYIHKFRISSEFEVDQINSDENKMALTHLPELKNLKHSVKLLNNYTRIVLAGKDDNLRITFDANILFSVGSKVQQLDDIVIAEFKYEIHPTDYIQKIINLGVIPTSFSKYCIGTALLNKNVKRNNFKSNLVKIKQWNF